MHYSTAKIKDTGIFHQNISGVFGKTFQTKPSPDTENRIGKLFGFIRIETEDKQVLAFIDFIIKNAKNFYYTTKDSAKKLPSLLDIENRLEKTLQKTNHAIGDYLQKHRLMLDLKKITILIGAIREKNICFTAIGEAEAYLIHFRKQRGYSIIPIYEKPITKKEEIHPLKFFTQTITGRIESRDFLFFCTTNILDYLSLEKIKNIITQHSLNDAVRLLETILSSIQLPNAFLFTIIQPVSIHGTDSRPQTPEKHSLSSSPRHFLESMDKLQQTEQITEKLLNPNIHTNIKKYTFFLQEIISRYSLKVKENIVKKISISASSKKEASQKKEKKLDASFLRGKIFPSVFRRIKNTLGLMSRMIQFLLKRFFRLPRKTQVIIVILFFLSLLLSYSIISLSISKRSKRIEERLNNLVMEIRKIKDSAEASVIYQDENGAREKLIQAKALIYQVPEDFKNTQQIQSLQREIEERLRELSHIQSLPETLLLGNWRNLDPHARLAPFAVLVGDIFYTQNFNNKQIYKLHRHTRVLSSLLTPLENVGNFQFAAPLEKEIILLNDQLTFFSFNTKDDSIRPLTTKFREGMHIASLATFRGRVYLLDTQNNQIYRYTKTSLGLGSPREWITDSSIDVSDGVDMAIDGNIYILKKDGQILKLSLGKQVAFSLGAIDPPLSQPTKLYTSPDSEFLYILEPSQKRLVVFDKDGNLAHQLIADIFSDAVSFTLLENERSLFLYTGTAVYGIPLSQLL